MRKFAIIAVLLMVFAAVIPAFGHEDSNSGHIRIVHLSSDAPTVDVYVNGQKSDVAGLSFAHASAWAEQGAGSVQVALVPTGETKPVTTPVQFMLDANGWLTVAVVGSAVNGTLKMVAIVEDYQPIAEGSSRVTVFHGIEDAPTVDILVDGATVIRELAFPGIRGDNDGAVSLDVAAGTHHVKAVPFGRSQPVVLDQGRVIFVTGVNYLITAAGTVAEPRLVIVATNPA
jgi:hypothetical protein